MLRLQRIFKNYQETGAFNEQVNLYGFIDSNVFLTKSGELGVILEVRGVDYECLDDASIDGLTKRLESALKLFDENYRVYQYIFKRNNEAIPYKLYGNPVVDTAIRNRIAYLAAKADTLFSLSVYYAIFFEGSRPKRKIGSALAKFPEQPVKALGELWTYFSTRKQVVFLDREITKSQAILLQKADSFILQVSDFLTVRLLEKQEAFRILKKTLNFAPEKLELAKLKYDTFLDYYLCESHLECHRRHLRLDDYYVRVLTLKEPSAQSFPLIFKRLLDVGANYYVVTEWKREDSGKTRRIIQAKRRHFHNTKRSFISQVNLNDAAPQDVLLDDSKESQVRELGEGIKEIELHGNYFGQFSLTVVIYDLDLAKVDRACAEFYKVFSVHDAQLYEEKYNLLNAFLASVPGNHIFNLRYLYLLNTNYADFSFLFTLHCGEPRNQHLRQEYLAVLETNHHTPYFLNLHYRDVAHTMILGRTGAGKSFLLNFLVTNLQKYAPHTFIFDLGGSFESLTHLFGGSYVRVGLESEDFKINPFSLPPTKENLDFLALFLKVLVQGSGTAELDPATERDLYHQIENLYSVDPALRTLGVLTNTLGHEMSERLARWTRGGQFGFLFDNSHDTISFSRFQCFDFQGMSQYPEILEPLLFYILHRANAVIADRRITQVFKAFFIDEAWVFLKNPSIQRYVVEALKTWRKHNAAMVLSTQSLDELRRSDILDVIIESCATKIFLANPDMDRELYRRQFHLNENEVEVISNLIPKQQFLIKTPELAKVANLTVDRKSYWLYTNDPYDNRKRREAFENYGFEKGLEVLAGEHA
ncbi:MAG TPA: type IV secretion system DNA-binding domain-containing protein [Candidatus Acidoferrales bacterium]|nr:type IV secretion system DNA-binding domain-containing protein [Candidatus Acidoferrales bacterium]